MRTKYLQKLMDKAKKTPCSMLGIYLKGSTKEERRYIIDCGYRLQTSRKYEIYIITYPQEARAQDLRDKVLTNQKP